MINQNASALLRQRLMSLYGDQVPGCVFLVTRNGEPFADGSFGWARLPSAAHPLQMSSTTLVHTGSIAKLISAIATLRLIQEWNWVIANSLEVVSRTGGAKRQFRPGIHTTVEDAHFVATVFGYNAGIDLNTKFYPLVESWLDQNLIALYRARTDSTKNYFPGKGVADITLGQLLRQKSGLAGDYDDADLGLGPTGHALTHADVASEPGDGGPSIYDLKKIVTAILRKDVQPNPSEYAQPYKVQGAVIEAVTGQLYTTWARKHLFPDSGFDDIQRKPIDHARSALYYYKASATSPFSAGNEHPDYTHFSPEGGWYWSATEFCEWFDDVMMKQPIGGAPILSAQDQLLDVLVAKYGTNFGIRHGLGKNGNASPGGGQTNASFKFLRGPGEDRICVFTELNANINADTVLDQGMASIAAYLNSRPGPIPVPVPAGNSGLVQAVYWDQGGQLGSAAKVAPVLNKPVTIAGTQANRTDLFGDDALAGGRTPNDISLVELRGMLAVPATGMYRFRLSSDDGSVLWIDGELIIDNEGGDTAGAHPLQSRESPDLSLAEGRHTIRVQWYNSGAGGSLYLEWKTPATAGYSAIPSANFSPL